MSWSQLFGRGRTKCWNRFLEESEFRSDIPSDYMIPGEAPSTSQDSYMFGRVPRDLHLPLLLGRISCEFAHKYLFILGVLGRLI